MREYARRKETWIRFKEMPYELTGAFYSDLRDISEAKLEAREAKKERKFNNDIDVEVEIFKLGYTYWMNVYKKVEKEKVLSIGDILFIKSMAEIIRKSNLLTSAQAKRLIKIYNAAEDAGIIFE